MPVYTSMDRETVRDITNSLLNNASQERGDARSVIEKFVRQANSNLKSNSNYASNLLKLAAAQNQLQQNTLSLQKNISGADSQVLDATAEAKRRQQASGLGTTGLGIYNMANTAQADANTLNQIQQAANANRQTLDTMDLYSAANRSAILSNVQNIIGNINEAGSGFNKYYAQKGKKLPYWEQGGNTIAGEDLESVWNTIDNEINQTNQAGINPGKKPDFGTNSNSKGSSNDKGWVVPPLLA